VPSGIRRWYKEVNEIKSVFLQLVWRQPVDINQETRDPRDAFLLITYDGEWPKEAGYQIYSMRTHYKEHHTFIEREDYPVALAFVLKKRDLKKKENGKVDEARSKQARRTEQEAERNREEANETK
jgi:hypothetical protein